MVHNGLLSRRELNARLLSLAALAGAGPLALGGCSSDNVAPTPSTTTSVPPIAGAGVDVKTHPFPLMRELRELARTSSDHLVSRASKLVADADARKIFEFVRDDIATIPSDYQSMSGVETVTRWGTRATLRCGAGTPREQCELLVELLSEAGVGATVLATRFSPTPIELQSILHRPVDWRFDAAMSEDRLAEWESELGVEAPRGNLETIGDEEAAELATKLFDLIPEDRLPGWRGFDYRPGRRYPVVAIELAGGTKIGNPINVGSQLVPEAGSDTSPAAEMTPPLSITVSLHAAFSGAPADRRLLVEGTWSAADLAGRQLVIQTPPLVEFDQLPSARVSDVRVFAPSLRLQGADLSLDERTDLSVVGEAFTISGERLTPLDDGGITIDGRTLSVDPTVDASSVDTINVVADGSFFPDVRLRVEALDFSGLPVEGLAGGAFRVIDEAIPVGFNVEANRRDARVLLLADESFSMPEEFYGDGMQRLIDDFTRRIEQELPGTSVTSQLTDSNLWASLAKAAGSDVSTVVYFTDGDVRDEPTPEVRSALAAGPPAVIVGVKGERAVFSEMADATGGVTYLVEQQAEASDAILGFVAAQQILPYQFRFIASDAETGPRLVRVETADGATIGEAEYIVPPPAQRLLASRIYGLYLTVKIGDQEVTRTLAGFDERSDVSVIDPALAFEAHAALLGTYVLAIEGLAPTAGVLLDDLLGIALEVEPLNRAAQQGSADGIKEALERGFGFLPPELFHTMLSVHDVVRTDSLVFPTGLSVNLLARRPSYSREAFFESIDALPTTRYVGATATPDEKADGITDFRRTMEVTSRVGLVENAIADVSTLSIIAGAMLQRIETRRDFGDLSVDLQRAWESMLTSDEFGSHFISARDPTLLAAWRISPRGEVAALLDDGSAGGRWRWGVVEELFAQTLFIMAGVLVATVLQVGGGVGSTGRNIARGFAIAIVLVGLAPPNEEFRDWARSSLLVQGVGILALVQASAAADGSRGGLQDATRAIESAFILVSCGIADSPDAGPVGPLKNPC